jgi:hypothetical protein
MDKDTALLLRAPLGSVRGMAGLPGGRGALGVPVGAATAGSRRRGKSPSLRVGRGLARGGGGTRRATTDGFGSVTQERKA